MSNTCDTCKHWDEGECMRAASTGGSAEVSGSLAIAYGYESSSGYLMTAGEFGCVQWVEA